MTEIILKEGKEESLKRFHPWVFSGAIKKICGKAEEGEVVRVADAHGNFLGIGHFQNSSIAVRILSFDDTELTEAYWENRISKAYDVRRSLGLMRDDNNTYRLVHGEGDSLPGLIVDIYDHTAIMQAHSAGMHYARHAIAKAILKVMGDTIQNIYYKSETTLPYKAGIDSANEYLAGKNAGNTAMENGLKFLIDWERGQKTGFFIDQRENRSLLEKYAQGKSVLNMFCYTGGFSCYAMRGGAVSVDSVDSSGKAIDIVNKNIALNFGDDTRHHAYTTDAFKFLDDIQDKYDLIILDPPAFAKHKDVLRNALQGYKKLNAKAFEQIKKGGILFTFSCSQAVSKEQFRLAVFSAAAQSKRNVRILHQLTQPADHPINIYHPEGEYLKGLVLYVE
ncbi:MAG: class I SAM-dependent rRNA methyltransferase [Bacteroidales bacterium]|nr:class I SAM-dependent rRNA methyltransferase [Bacteroidales bacterium]